MRFRAVAAAMLALAFSSLPATVAAADELKCGPHQHVASEKDPDEGGTVKRCECDEGWNAGGPGAPCRSTKGKSSEKSKGGDKKPEK